MFLIEFETEDGEYRIEQLVGLSMKSGRYMVNGLFVEQETFFQVRRSVIEVATRSPGHVIVLADSALRLTSNDLLGAVPL